MFGIGPVKVKVCGHIVIPAEAGIQILKYISPLIDMEQETN
jgi:hypothetical protein